MSSSNANTPTDPAPTSPSPASPATDLAESLGLLSPNNDVHVQPNEQIAMLIGSGQIEPEDPPRTLIDQADEQKKPHAKAEETEDELRTSLVISEDMAISAGNEEPTLPSRPLMEISEEERSNWLSWIIFGFATPLFVTAWQRRRESARIKALNNNESGSSMLSKMSTSMRGISRRFNNQAPPAYKPGDASLRPSERKLLKPVDGELEEDDFWLLSGKDHVEPLFETFHIAYAKYGKKKPRTKETAKSYPTKHLNNAIYTLISVPMIAAGCVKFFNTALQVAYPLLLRQMLYSLQPSSGRPISSAYWWAFGLGIATLTKALTENVYFWLAARAGWQIRSALSQAVYAKSLRLSMASRQKKTLGEITNLMQLDTSRIESFIVVAHSLWDGIVQIIAYTFVIYSFVGWPAFVGFAFMCTLIPVQLGVMKSLMGISRNIAKKTDVRVKKVNEVLQGMLGIKMSAWEDSFEKAIRSVRDEETTMLWSSIWLKSFSSSYVMAMPALTSIVCLVVYAGAQNGIIDAATLFSTIQTFNQLRFPLMLYPMALALYAQAHVARQRLADFLDLSEISFLIGDLDPEVSGKDVVVDLKNVTAFWADPDAIKNNDEDVKKTTTVKRPSFLKRTFCFWRKSDASSPPESIVVAVVAPPTTPMAPVPAVQDVSLSIRVGELVAIVGGVGEGKTALVNALLGELHLTQGSISMLKNKGGVAYASQTPWILNATVRENIVFGSEFDKQWYADVVESCQLVTDLKMLPEGDMTEIGERGVSLSGGQKSRVALARAAYHSRHSLMILADDPLSALDPEVSGRLFQHLFLDLLQGTTRVVVTNALDVLKKCDRVIVITGGDGLPGKITEQGTYSDLMKAGSNFSALIKRHQDVDKESVALAVAVDDADKSTTEKPLEKREKFKQFKRASTSVMNVEERSKGAVKNSVYAAYIMAGGGWLWFSFVYSWFIISQGVAFINIYWITLWVNDARAGGTNGYARHSLTFYLVGYALTGIFMALTGFIRTSAIMVMGIRAATTLHTKLLITVLHAPMSFFDTTPTGRVLQRFSGDIHALDNDLTDNASFFMFTTLFVVVSLGTIIGVTPIFAAFLIPFGLIYYAALTVYRPVLRDAKRIGSIVTSPVLQHFSETLGGLPSIRAFDATHEFLHRSAERLNRMVKMSIALKACERWLSVRLELLGSAISLVASMLAVYAVQTGSINAGTAGLSIVYSMSLTSLLTSTIRSFAQLEAGMNSVERVRYMGEETPQEKWKSDDYLPRGALQLENNWPAKGEIVVENLSMRYRPDTPIVLNGLSFTIKGGEKIGVAGRTGSGKSSLFLTLLRIVEPLPGSRIAIDGVDVSKIALVELRSRLVIAPQLPVLFSGTVRYNLDPFLKYADAEIWFALEKVSMKATIEALDGGLDAKVSEYGENFSQGERQLISIVRAILAKPNVLLMDESTASIDADRDVLIQNAIRENFKLCTLVVIAHRLQTILKSDRILVLGKGGVILEFDRPDALLANPESQLSLAVKEMGR